MAVEIDLDQLEREEGGRGLRSKLEQTLAELGKTNKELATYQAKEVVREKGYHLVEPSDLAGVSPSQIEAKAKELHEQRLGQQRKLAADLLARQGLEGDELEEAVTRMVSPAAPAPEPKPVDDPFARVNELANTGGSAPRVVDPSQLHGIAAIQYAIAQKEAKQKR